MKNVLGINDGGFMTQEKSPLLSVIVPAKNEAKLLPKCLSSLTQQRTQVGYEVIVVDTNSTDGTPDIARSFGVRLINEPRRGKIYAFRSGVDAAEGMILCFTEADCILPDHWIQTIADHFQQHPDVVAISGTYTFHSSTPLYNFMGPRLHRIANKIYELIYGAVSLRCSNSAIRRSVYQEVGGFSDRYFELYDVELGQRVAKLGAIHHVPAMQIQTSDRRIRGRILRFILEFIPSFYRNIVLKRPPPSQTYEDIR
jgi:glycosyltransferase involved in cell wall biosynthesis